VVDIKNLLETIILAFGLNTGIKKEKIFLVSIE
jgi:hypothetical protein